MSNLSGLRLVTLDLTGTVFRFRMPPFVLYREVAASFGIDCDEAELRNGFSVAYKSLSKNNPSFGSTTNMDSKSWWTQIVHYSFKTALGDSYPASQVDRVATEIYDIYATGAPYLVYSDAKHFLDRLKEKERRTVKIGAVTNFDRRILSVLKALDILKTLDFIVYSEAVQCSKPGRRIFEAAIQMSELQNLDPREALHVGDDIENDYLGAKEAGWNAILIDRSSAQDAQQRVPSQDVCQNLVEVLERLPSHAMSA